MNDKTIMSVREASDALKVSETTIYKYLRKGILKETEALLGVRKVKAIKVDYDLKRMLSRQVNS